MHQATFCPSFRKGQGAFSTCHGKEEDYGDGVKHVCAIIDFCCEPIFRDFTDTDHSEDESHTRKARRSTKPSVDLQENFYTSIEDTPAIEASSLLRLTVSVSLFYSLEYHSGCRTPASPPYGLAREHSLTRNHAKLNRWASIIPSFPFFHSALRKLFFFNPLSRKPFSN